MTRDVDAEYRAFVQNAPSDDDGYLFDRPKCRFWPEPTDELLLAPGAHATSQGSEVRIVLPSGASLAIAGLALSAVQAALAALPCRVSRLMVVLGADCQSFVEQTFSRVLFAPAAVAALEARVASAELVRFPGSPYEIVRSYWQNSALVRERIEAHGLSVSAAELKPLLLELHRLALVGNAAEGERSSFYLPASALGRKRVTPGRFYDAATSTETRGGDVIITSGARVSVPLLGGRHYWQLLAESVSDLGALDDARSVRDGELELGRVVVARAENEADSRPWFLPPRPLTEAHFEALAAALGEARAAEAARDVAGVLTALGRFHYRFVRIHPLPSANQSLSMNIVSSVLGRVLGAGIPHLLLDQLALRFEPRAYEILFERAARVWSWPSQAISKSERLRQLLRMRADLDAFVSRLGSAASVLEARASLDDSSARLALL